MPRLSGLKVVRSPKHGYGVVATRPFARGEVIAQVDGYLWTEDQNLDDTYSLYVDETTYYDMLDQTRWVNHSCDPNADVEAERGDEGQGWARIVALRAIAVGEEIAYDYAFPAALAEPCRCGAARCRGFIVAEDALGDLLDQQRRRRVNA